MNKKPLFQGSAVALVTPFTETGVDFKALENLLEFQIKNKTDAIVICGTTGEPATMTAEEKKEVIKFCIEKINKRVTVIVGTGTNNTKTAIENSVFAEQAGADGLLAVTPYYNKCTQKGLEEYYLSIAESVNIPVIAYNVPGRTGVNILPKTMEKISEHRNINGIKEASANIDQITDTANRIKDKCYLYSGDDAVVLPIMALGGKGVISVAANVIPEKMNRLTHFALQNNYEKAKDMQLKLYPFIKALFVEVNPIPAKYVLSKMGLCKNILREPLTTLEKTNESLLDGFIKEFIQ